MDYQRLGPFVINRKINDGAFLLDLPPQLRIHLVFHNSILEPCRVSSIPNHTTPPPPPIESEDGLEYEVAAILESNIVHNKLYIIWWIE